MHRVLGIRSRRGNMVAFITGTMVVMAALIFFGLWYAQHSLNGTSHRSAIDSAALAAANALARIVVNTPEYGYVSLVGSGPTSLATVAGDNYYQRVYSINELMATARVDAVIANQLNEPTLQKLAAVDAANAQSAANQLFTALKTACQDNGSGKDIDGNDVSPQKDAVAFYLTNPTLASTFVPNSLHLALGGLNTGKGIATAVQVPTSKTGLGAATAALGNRYMSDCDQKVGNLDFVFAAVGDQPGLVPNQNWIDTVPGIPYQMPAVVQVNAMQQFTEGGRTDNQRFQACATAGGDYHAVASGAFTIACPDGNMDEVQKPADLWSATFKHDTDGPAYTSIGGDFPTSGGALSPAFNGPNDPWSKSNQPQANEVALTCFYDWLRQAGSHVDVDSIIAMTNQNLSAPNPAKTPWLSKDAGGISISVGSVPTGIMHIFEIDPQTGAYKYKTKTIKPEPYYPVRMNQLYAENYDIKTTTADWGLLAVVALDPDEPLLGPKAQTISAKDKFDTYYRDYCRVLGDQKGGKHVGEPMLTDTIAWTKDYGVGGSGAGKGGLPPIVSELIDGFFKNPPADFPPTYESGTDGTPPGEPRKTYATDGLDCVITFRRQLDVKALGLLTIKTGYKGLML